MTPAVSVRRLSKTYTGHREQYRALRDVLSGGRRRSTPRSTRALVDVSFDVPAGEVLGVIGGNGAGKSTLFKILSRVSAPTSGEAELRGQLGAMLEVGTGFHPELTGMENVFLNGAILGMTRRQIRARVAEIVDFAEVPQAMDTLVKHFSVGMYMRLAFAVAAHLEPDILLIDEVLAVGDARFQEKCLAKVGELGRSGRTVLFVSHQLDAVAHLCDRCILLRQGRLVDDGDPATVISGYLRDDTGALTLGRRLALDRSTRVGTAQAQVEWLCLTAPGGSVEPGAELRLTLGIRCDQVVLVRSAALSISTEGGALLADLDGLRGAEPLTLVPGRSELELSLGPLPLTAGRYRLGFRLANPVTTRLGSGAIDHVEELGFLQVLGAAQPGAGPLLVEHRLDRRPSR
ncbi:MAG: ABC transporter ATP-binding protein [Mycobacteriales bacterium]